MHPLAVGDEVGQRGHVLLERVVGGVHPDAADQRVEAGVDRGRLGAEEVGLVGEQHGDRGEVLAAAAVDVVARVAAEALGVEGVDEVLAQDLVDQVDQVDQILEGVQEKTLVEIRLKLIHLRKKVLDGNLFNQVRMPKIYVQVEMLLHLDGIELGLEVQIKDKLKVEAQDRQNKV